MTDKTKTDEITKEDQSVDTTLANVVQDLIKTKDTLIVEKSSKIEELEKKLAELNKVVNANPVDGGIEQPQGVKATDPDDVGTDAKAKNDIAPKPSEAQADIIPPAVKEPSKDETSVTMENKADDSEEKKPEEKKEEVKKDEEPKKEEKKEETKTEEVKKSDATYKIVETVRPMIKARADNDNVPTAYQMLKAVENGFGETRDAAQALVIMHQKMLKGEFGDGNPSRGGY